MFYICLRKNSNLCHLQHKLIGFYNRDEKCLLCGTDWVFKYSGLRFVFKRLKHCFPYAELTQFSHNWNITLKSMVVVKTKLVVTQKGIRKPREVG